jgi:hypothetical protein
MALCKKSMLEILRTRVFHPRSGNSDHPKSLDHRFTSWSWDFGR